ncbi:MAG: putative peptidase [Syntrophorhabdus sp. PtaB.Bin047]|jgi:Xaa-Pro aminopeptidase|nr:MAG: putative peptidase [Syntrophorhabdus sp. PtaB.Bin047]
MVVARQARIERVQNLLEETGLDGCVLKGMDNIFYLTGFRGSEGSLFVTRGDVVLVVDFRYMTHAREVTRDIHIEEMRPKRDAIYDLCTKYRISKLGFDGAHVPYNVYKSWAENLVGISLVPMSNAIEEVRRAKEPEEISAIMAAIEAATKAFTDVLGLVKPGSTEKEIADELDHAMRRRGATGPSFETIVASGPRGALPHAEPSDRRLGEGETVIIDYGAAVAGYCSDETVTVCLGEIPDKLSEIYTIVNDARKLGIEKARAGTSIAQLDSIVRGYIEEHGYGDFFRHGVGHGVGIAVHEAPGINSVARGILEENMVVTIEPGIYLPNIGGVRLEDMVLITEDSPRVLTHIRKDIIRM